MPRSLRPSTFEIRFRPRNTPRRTLIADLRRVARETGRGRLTLGLYAQKGRFATNTMMRRFGSWNAALMAAGLPVIQHWSVPDSVLFQNLAGVWRALGRQPTGREMTKAGNFSRFALSTYKLRFGTWHKALHAFAAHVRRGSRPDRPCRKKKRKAAAAAVGRAPRRINWRLRATVLIRDNCLCRMCGASPAKDPAVTLHVDHIMPWSKGGRTTPDNLQTLCAACNIGKGNRLPPKRRQKILRAL